jgi:YbgC/YbaW family acyl-CoA thioester hydrolase
MNLYFRLILVILKALRRDTITPALLKNSILVRMMPNDLDVNMHVNNGRYLTLCDLTRVDFFVRSGIAALMLKHKWSPIIAEHTMTYLRPIKVFTKIEIRMEITHFDEKYFYCSHHFYKGDKLMAQGTSKALVISKTGSLTPQYTLDKVAEYQASKHPESSYN